MTKIHISSEGDKPYSGVERQLGKLNIGLYCESCGEFFALAVVPDGTQPFEIISDGPIPLLCPFCQHRQRRQVAELHRVVLTESNKRKRSLH